MAGDEHKRQSISHLQLEFMQHRASINQVGKDEKGMISSIRK